MKKLISASAILFLLCVSGAYGAITQVGTTSLPAGQTSTGSNTFTVTSTTGNLNVVVINCDYSLSITGVIDPKGNTWTVDPIFGSGPPASSDTGGIYIAYSLSATTGVTSVTVASSGTGGVMIAFYDFASTTGGALDTTVVFNNQGPTLNPALTLTASNAGVVIAGLSVRGAPTGVASPFTYDNIDPSGPTRQWGTAAHDVNASAGSYTATFTVASSANWSGVIAAFKEASVGPSAQCSPRAVLQY